MRVLTPWSTAPAEEESVAVFRALVDRFQIPGSFVEERNQNILNSFGYKEESESSSCTWLHFLLKEVEHDEEPIPNVDPDRSPLFGRLGRLFNKPPTAKLKAQDHEPEKSRRYIPFRQSTDAQEPYAPTWSRCAFFLRAEKVSQVSKVGDQSPRYNVTLISFDAPAPTTSELEAISSTLNVEDILKHPYILWEIILYHLSMFLDVEMWDLVKVFRTEQNDLGYLTGTPSKPLGDLDFSRLHLLADHIILILEGAKGLQASMDGLIDHHEAELGESPSFLARKTHIAIKYRRRFVQSTTERGITFEKRINNMISLFFNHVSLQDSGLMMRDSSSLRGIALITLFFLPITTVSTICGSEFIYSFNGPDGSKSVRMDPAAWKMFLVSGVATLALVGMWVWQLNRLEKQFLRGQAGRLPPPGNMPLAV